MQSNQPTSQRESIFNNEVISRFELYNSLFLTLPFYKVKDTGTLLPLFIKSCEDGVKNHQKPATLIEGFFEKYTANTDAKDIVDLLFRFIQYIERQVVLFDAVEDASFNKLNVSDEQSSLRALFLKANDDKTLHER
jgi:phosphoenolpyruvate carboxylase